MMNRTLLVIPILLFWILIYAIPAQAAEVTAPLSDPGVLCLPGIYMDTPVNCSPAGPSAYLTRMAKIGIDFPPTPIPAVQPDTSLTYVDVRYGLVNKRNAPVYGSLEDAQKGIRKNKVNRIDASFSYISYTDEVVVDGKRFYMLEPGEWMTANDIVRIGSVPLFQGLTISRTPDNPFGWILSYLNYQRLVVCDSVF